MLWLVCDGVFCSALPCHSFVKPYLTSRSLHSFVFILLPMCGKNSVLSYSLSSVTCFVSSKARRRSLQACQHSPQHAMCCPFCKVAARMANGAFRTLCSRAKHFVIPNRYLYTYIHLNELPTIPQNPRYS